MRLAVFLTMPSAVGLWFFAEPIISLIYEHGKFHSMDSSQTAFALQFYALGLVAYSCIKVLSPGFYAIDKKWTPMLVSFIAIMINVILNYILIFILHMGHRGLALSTAVSASVNFLTLYLLMMKSYNLQTLYFLSTTLRCGIASLLLGIVCWFTLTHFMDYLHSPSFWLRALSLMLSITGCSITYLIAAALLRVTSARDIMKKCSTSIFK